MISRKRLGRIQDRYESVIECLRQSLLRAEEYSDKLLRDIERLTDNERLLTEALDAKERELITLRSAVKLGDSVRKKVIRERDRYKLLYEALQAQEDAEGSDPRDC